MNAKFQDLSDTAEKIAQNPVLFVNHGDYIICQEFETGLSVDYPSYIADKVEEMAQLRGYRGDRSAAVILKVHFL